MGAGGRGGPAFCTQCGAQRGPDDRFCTGCGAALATVDAPSPAPPPTAPAGQRTGGIPLAARLAISAIVVAAVGAATWIIASPDDDPDQGAVPVATEPLVQAPAEDSTMLGEDVWTDGVDASEDEPAALDVLGPGEPPAPVSGSFELGPVEHLTSLTIAADGGTVVAPDGLLIDVPAGAYDGALEYTVSKQEILSHEFPTGVNPISPLYTVDNGGSLAAEAMWVEVPADVPPNGFAMGFLYDQATGDIEALPLVGVGTDSVVVATGHFSQFFIHGVDAAAFAAIVGTEAALDAQSNAPTTLADSGFRPGTDDWSFPNVGSYIARRGHCAGQSISAMWYFLERTKQGAPPLHSTYDNDGLGATGRWQDDRIGYRLSSAVHSDYGDRVQTWVERVQRYFDRWRLELAASQPDADDFDLLQFTAFVVALRTTGEPQYVSIGRLYIPQPGAGTTTTAVPEPRRAGHAMVVYGADTRGLWIADPNKPGGFRRIPWDPATSTLGPYYSGPNATTLGLRYDSINLMGKTSLVDWAGVGLRFTDADAGIAGDDVFPGYQLEVLEHAPDGTSTWVPLDDGHTTPLDEIEVRMTFEEPASWLLTSCEDAYPDRCVVTNTKHTTPIKLALDDHGDNQINLLVAGPRNQRWKYLDYARVTVHRSVGVDLSVVPPRQSVAPGDAITLQIEVTNLLGREVTGTDVYVWEEGVGDRCDSTIASLPAGAAETVECSFIPQLPSGTHLYDVVAEPDGLPSRTVLTEITIEEAVAVTGGSIIDALNSFHETVLGFRSEAAEERSESRWQQWLTASPAPLEVYSVNAASPAFVGVYATEAEAQAALQAIADAASNEIAANTGADVPWCDWYRVTLDRPMFHGGESFVLSTWQKAIDYEPGEPGIQPAPPDFPWCETSEAEIVSSYGYPVVETSTDRVGWVQGNLVVTLNPAWTPDAAEILYAELAALTTE